MISQTPLERIPALEAKASEIIEEVCNLNAIDLSPLPNLTKAFSQMQPGVTPHF